MELKLSDSVYWNKIADAIGSCSQAWPLYHSWRSIIDLSWAQCRSWEYVFFTNRFPFEYGEWTDKVKLLPLDTTAILPSTKYKALYLLYLFLCLISRCWPGFCQSVGSTEDVERQRSNQASKLAPFSFMIKNMCIISCYSGQLCSDLYWLTDATC